MKRWLQRRLRSLGFEVRRVRSTEDHLGYSLFPYRAEDGSFDYDEYLRVQTAGNKRKLDRTWAVKANIDFLADYIRDHVETPRFGICHGTRRGDEQVWFRELLECEVIGTEISDTASQFPHTIQWDFHEVKQEWLGAADFIYSNSFDHSYDPKKCLDAWMSCLTPDGLCIIEHSAADTPSRVNDLDPLGVELVAFPYLVARWSEGRYSVRRVIDAPSRAGAGVASTFLILQNN